MSRLSRLASLLQALVWFAILLLVLMPSAAWLLGLTASARGMDQPLIERVVIWAIAMPPYLLVAFGLTQLAAFCRGIRTQRFFTLEAMKGLQRFGWSLLAASLFYLPSRLMPVWLGLTDVALGPLPFLAPTLGVIFGLVFVAFANVLSEASRLADENASFV